MKLTKMILAGATIAMTGFSALAQQAVTGSVIKIDEPNGKITIQETQTGTTGSNTGGGAAAEFKVQDGLLFNALQPGDRVTFTATDIGGVKTITNLKKQ